MIYFTSDPHYYHKNVIKYCDRPFKDMDDMVDKLILNWNSVVHEEDLVYILGDFSFGGVQKTTNVINSLTGNKVLIQGNHDWKFKPEKWKKLGMAAVYDVAQIDIGGQQVFMSHFPYKPRWWEKWFYRHDTIYPEKRIKRRKNYLLHGHVHNSWKVRGREINVGVDVWDYKPVSLVQIAELMGLVSVSSD